MLVPDLKRTRLQNIRKKAATTHCIGWSSCLIGSKVHRNNLLKIPQEVALPDAHQKPDYVLLIIFSQVSEQPGLAFFGLFGLFALFVGQFVGPKQSPRHHPSSSSNPTSTRRHDFGRFLFRAEVPRSRKTSSTQGCWSVSLVWLFTRLVFRGDAKKTLRGGGGGLAFLGVFVVRRSHFLGMRKRRSIRSKANGSGVPILIEDPLVVGIHVQPLSRWAPIKSHSHGAKWISSRMKRIVHQQTVQDRLGAKQGGLESATNYRLTSNSYYSGGFKENTGTQTCSLWAQYNLPWVNYT